MDNLYCDLTKLKYLGRGTIIGKSVRIRRPEDTIIGDHTIIDDFTYISCTLTVGKYCHIGPHVTISGGSGKVTIGDFVGIACGASIHPACSDYLSGSFELPSIPKEFQFGGECEEIIIEDHVLLGANSVVLPGVHLPEGFASGAHTVISRKKYQPWALYRGLNARMMVRREHAKVLDAARRLRDANL